MMGHQAKQSIFALPSLWSNRNLVCGSAVQISITNKPPTIAYWTPSWRQRRYSLCSCL